jgi:DNA-directed RNA polymerase subunit N (RpoN/RPB10)
VSGLDELTKEDLKALVNKLYETVQAQQAEIAELRATVERQSERISELEEEVARLRGGRPGVELCIKPSVPKKEKGPRKPRKQSFARHCLVATQVVYHALDRCPDCGRGLSGGHVKWRHQVVDLPVAKADVVDHLFLERYCGVCGKRCTPDPSLVLAGVVLGKKSVGIRLMSVIAHLKTVCRVPSSA